MDGFDNGRSWIPPDHVCSNSPSGWLIVVTALAWSKGASCSWSPPSTMRLEDGAPPQTPATDDNCGDARCR
jgi:hypothetical protein